MYPALNLRHKCVTMKHLGLSLMTPSSLDYSWNRTIALNFLFYSLCFLWDFNTTIWIPKSYITFLHFWNLYQFYSDFFHLISCLFNYDSFDKFYSLFLIVSLYLSCEWYNCLFAIISDYENSKKPPIESSMF